MIGTPILLPKVGKVVEDGSAQRAGIRDGDMVLFGERQTD